MEALIDKNLIEEHFRYEYDGFFVKFDFCVGHIDVNINDEYGFCKIIPYPYAGAFLDAIIDILEDIMPELGPTSRLRLPNREHYDYKPKPLDCHLAKCIMFVQSGWMAYSNIDYKNE